MAASRARFRLAPPRAGAEPPAARPVRSRRCRRGAVPVLPVPVPERPWRSAAAPRCSRTTPSRCGTAPFRPRASLRAPVPAPLPVPAPAASLAGPRRGAAPARPRERGAGRLQPLRERRGEPGVGPGPAVSRGRLPGALPGARRVAAGRSRRLSASLSVPQPPPPPYHAPAGAPPAVGVPPPQGTAQPPRRASPTEPRNYGSYGTQVPGLGGGSPGGPGEERAAERRVSSAGLGGSRHGRAAEASGGAEPQGGGAGPAGAGAAERRPRQRCQ